MDTGTSSACSSTLCTRPWAHVSWIYVSLHLWWRFYFLINPCTRFFCVCVRVMRPRSGNLVESGTSRLSLCQMQQIPFQYQAGKTQPIRTQRFRGRFITSVPSVQSGKWIDSEPKSRSIYRFYYTILHAIYSRRIWFRMISYLCTFKNFNVTALLLLGDQNLWSGEKDKNKKQNKQQQMIIIASIRAARRVFTTV